MFIGHAPRATRPLFVAHPHTQIFASRLWYRTNAAATLTLEEKSSFRFRIGFSVSCLVPDTEFYIDRAREPAHAIILQFGVLAHAIGRRSSAWRCVVAVCLGLELLWTLICV